MLEYFFIVFILWVKETGIWEISLLRIAVQLHKLLISCYQQSHYGKMWNCELGTPTPFLTLLKLCVVFS